MGWFSAGFPETGTQAGVTTVETVGIHYSGLVLRDVTAILTPGW